MDKSNLSDSEENVRVINNVLLLYSRKPEQLPVGVEYADIQDIKNIDFSKYEHILIQDLLDLYDDTQVPELLSLLSEKTNQGCKLEIQGIDLKQLCIAVANGDVDIDLAKDIIFSRENIHNIYDIINFFKNTKYNVYEKRYINIFEYNLVAKNER